VCRCAAKAREKGFDYFGIQNYGECWSGDGDYSIHGEAPGNCINGDFKECKDDNGALCVGVEYVNYVYKLSKSKYMVFQEYLFCLFVCFLKC